MLSGRFGSNSGVQRTENRHWGPIPWKQEGAISGWIKPRGNLIKKCRVPIRRHMSNLIARSCAKLHELTAMCQAQLYKTLVTFDISPANSGVRPGFQKVLFTRARVGEALGLAARSFGNISILRQVLEILGTDPRKCAEHGRNRGAGVANQIVNYWIRSGPAAIERN